MAFGLLLCNIPIDSPILLFPLFPRPCALILRCTVDSRLHIQYVKIRNHAQDMIMFMRALRIYMRE